MDPFFFFFLRTQKRLWEESHIVLQYSGTKDYSESHHKFQYPVIYNRFNCASSKGKPLTLIHKKAFGQH